MDDSLMAYFEWIEIETFFPGYVLLFALIYLIAAKQPVTGFIRAKVLPKLPLAYALIGLAYWGLQLRNMYPDYELSRIASSFQNPFLKIWALLAILFWMPALRKKPVLSLLHSLLFFFLMIKDILLRIFSANTENDQARNDMKIYSTSILLNLLALALVTVTSLLIANFKNQKRDPDPGK